MDDAALVRRMQPGGDALEQGTHRLVGQRFAAEQFGKRLPFDELHREIGTPERRLDGEDVIADDRLVVQVVQRRCLAAEQPERGVVLGDIPDAEP